MSVKKSIELTSLPMFAQPVGVERPFQTLTQEKGSGSSIMLFTFPTLICGALLILARPNGAQTLGSGAKPTKTFSAKSELSAPVAMEPISSQTSLKPTVDPAASGVSAVDSSRRPLSYYTQGVRDNMFSAPMPPIPPPPAPRGVKAAPSIKVPVMEVNPFADWSYTGTIKMGIEMMALIENSKTKEGQYVKQGESFMNAKVSSITEQMVTLSSAGKPVLLAKSDMITTTPLDKSASNAPSQPVGGAPGMLGMPAMPPGVQGMPSAGDVRLPNGNVIPAERAARRARRMNRNFNGGGVGGGFGGNGGGFSGNGG